MRIQKTFRRKPASQWLAQAKIAESQAGAMEIFVTPSMIARYHPDGMVLETFDGPVALLELSESANRRFAEWCEVRDATAAVFALGLRRS